MMKQNIDAESQVGERKPFSDSLDDFKQYLRQPGRKSEPRLPDTIKCYLGDVKDFLGYMGSSTSFDEFGVEQVRAYFNDRFFARGTVQRRISSLNMFLGFASEQSGSELLRIPYSLLGEVQTRDTPNIDPLDEKSFFKVLDSIRNKYQQSDSESTIGASLRNNYFNLRDILCATLMWGFGMDPPEIVDLSKNEVDIAFSKCGTAVRVKMAESNGDVFETGGWFRDVPEISNYFQEREDFLKFLGKDSFYLILSKSGIHMDDRSMRKAFSKHCVGAGLKVKNMRALWK